MANSDSITPAVVIGIVIGVPSLFIALASLWLTYLGLSRTLSFSRDTPDPAPLLSSRDSIYELPALPENEASLPESASPLSAVVIPED